MSVNGIVSKGILFKMGDGASSETFATLSEINSIGLPNRSRPMIDMTDLVSAAREFKPGLLDEGSLTVGMNFTRDAYIDMEALLLSNDATNFQIVIPDTGSTTIGFAAFVQSMSGASGGPDDKISVDVTFKITGSLDISS